MNKNIFILSLCLAFSACKPAVVPEPPEPEDLSADAFTAGGAVANGVFSITDSTKVLFSRGNLQYHIATKIWRFAETQYAYFGESNMNIYKEYDGWIDLFNFGTGRNPTMTSFDWNDYDTFYDWGINRISNSNSPARSWRTLTKDEWTYLLFGRPNACQRMSFGVVNDIGGLILLPDEWKAPKDLTFTSPWTFEPVASVEAMYSVFNENVDSSYYAVNTYSAEDWHRMELRGAVFLPAAGIRWYNTDYYDCEGHYWSSTKNPSNVWGPVNNLFFNGRGVTFGIVNGADPRFGLSVRLVEDY